MTVWTGLTAVVLPDEPPLEEPPPLPPPEPPEDPPPDLEPPFDPELVPPPSPEVLKVLSVDPFAAVAVSGVPAAGCRLAALLAGPGLAAGRCGAGFSQRPGRGGIRLPDDRDSALPVPAAGPHLAAGATPITAAAAPTAATCEAPVPKLIIDWPACLPSPRTVATKATGRRLE